MIEFSEKDRKLITSIDELHNLYLKQKDYFNRLIKSVTNSSNYETDGTFGSRCLDELSDIIVDLIYQLENSDIVNMFDNLTMNNRNLYLYFWFGYNVESMCGPILIDNQMIKWNFEKYINTMFDDYKNNIIR